MNEHGPLKLWVIIRVRLPANDMGLRYQASETEASTAAFAVFFVAVAFELLLGVSVVVDITAEPTTPGVAVSAVITDLGFKSSGSL